MLINKGNNIISTNTGNKTNHIDLLNQLFHQQIVMECQSVVVDCGFFYIRF